MKSRFRAGIVTGRYWVNIAVIVILVVLPLFRIIKFDFLNGEFYTFGQPTHWITTATAFLGFWAGSYILTLTADFIYGRLFCGWICSWGSMLKALRYTGEKVKRKKLSPYVTEAVTFLAGLLSTVGLLNWFTDLSVLFQPAHRAFGPFIAIFTVLTIGSYIMLRFVGLKFCQDYCPIGWYLGVLSQKHMMRIDFEPANCTLGEVCVHDCVMGMDPRLLATDGDINNHATCVLCFDCISSCNACAAKVPGTKPLTVGISSQPVLEVDLEGILKQMEVDRVEARKAKRSATKVSAPLVTLGHESDVKVK